jgi:hypothetical protein
MSQRDKIRKILKEESYSPNVRDNFALGVLKFIYGRLYNYISTESGRDVKEWPGETLNDFINTLSDDIKKDADDVLQIVFHGVTERHNPLLYDIPQKDAIKLMYEFIFNYKNSGKRVGFDVVSDNDVYWYMRDRLFNCDDKFFEYVWDVFISDRSNYWNEQLKDRFWGEIEDEVIEKMEDEEWQEENGVTFDSLEREKSYFKTYWHYPIDSLGWDRDQLCDYYRDILESKDRDTLYKVLKHYKTPKKQQIFLGDTFYWVIDENLFY